MTAFEFRPTLNDPDDDPYLRLEDVEGEGTLAWAASQPARTLGHFGGTQFDRDRDALIAISTVPDKVPVTSAAVSALTFWQDAGIPRALWRRDHPCRYPPILLSTTKRACVHTGHARKTAAKLQAFGYSAYF
ncbi:hypothetical protein NKH57_31580 [Mesorhizobium sp. M1050]|uniref:hypothetical protein n=1 Tax=Mesorhizobium sp. M1050 TaxID=2957051 RepID=UPI00333B701D